MKYNSVFYCSQGRRQKNFQGGQWKKQDQKIRPLSLHLLYQYHVWKSREATPPCSPLPTPMIVVDFFIFKFEILGFVFSLAKDLRLVMFLILSKFEPHILNFLRAVHKGRPQSGGRRVIQCRHLQTRRRSSNADFRTFWCKKLWIFWNLWCVRTVQCGQFSDKGGRGQFFAILCNCRRSSWMAAYHIVLIKNSNIKIFCWCRPWVSSRGGLFGLARASSLNSSLTLGLNSLGQIQVQCLAFNLVHSVICFSVQLSSYY